MPTTQKQFIFRNLRAVAIWFLVVTVLISLYAKSVDPLPVSLLQRLLIAVGIVIFCNIPFVRAIGRIYRDTTPDDGDLDD
ncbi:membrane protein DedA with SNARE-associated domain [Sulfitobacter undariae]|uniref:Membrane protein DedA with SNARE-associated domain n=1 Tax=Sulfitobacter undariae TaxID=1563671 RepID=A0A7W6E1I4_9RHOB|nr:hypothetical protein [Sulfitobacter undariae]MBB3993008.1 membrane protein DedA with SNARE-associated domain [Sulfitobacter undariae]